MRHWALLLDQEGLGASWELWRNGWGSCRLHDRENLIRYRWFMITIHTNANWMFEGCLFLESPEFRLCYGRLVSTLQQLPDEQLDNIASHYLAPALVLENSLEAKTMVDALEAVAMNRQRGQELLVKYVFRASDFNKELIIRAIHVCFTVKEPSRVSIKGRSIVDCSSSVLCETGPYQCNLWSGLQWKLHARYRKWTYVVWGLLIPMCLGLVQKVWEMMMWNREPHWHMEH